MSFRCSPIVPSLRDGSLSCTQSRQFLPGYDHSVPPGQNRTAHHSSSASLCILFAAIPIREALSFRQHEIADNCAEIVTAGDELSKGSSSGAERVEGF
jgi:hypothetical protein